MAKEALKTHADYQVSPDAAMAQRLIRPSKSAGKSGKLKVSCGISRRNISRIRDFSRLPVLSTDGVAEMTIF
jgi:hypothetical protein